MKEAIKKILEQELKNYKNEGAPSRNIKLDLQKIRLNRLKKYNIAIIVAYQSGLYWNFKYISKGKNRPIRIPNLKIRIKGTKKNPIPVISYKSRNSYKSIRLKTKYNNKRKIYEYEDHKMENVTRLSYYEKKDGKRKRLTIGVAKEFIHFLINPQPSLIRKRETSRKKSSRFRTILKDFLEMQNITTMQIDHVQDLQLGGKDVYQNLWPLDININQKGTDVRYKADDKNRKKSNQIWRLKNDQTTKYWIIII